MHWKRWLLMGIVAVGVVLAILYGYRPQPVQVEVGKAARAPLRVSIEEEGKTRVTDRFIVSAPLAGYIRRINLEEGNAVRRGQIVATLEPLLVTTLDARARAQAEAQVAAAESAVAAARERVRAAQSDAAYWEGELARIAGLVKTGDVPRERQDRVAAEERRARATLAESEKRVDVAAAELRAARAALQVSFATRTSESIPVRAPVDGRVLKIVRESEGVVNPGDPLVELGSVRSLEVVVELLSVDAVKISPGTRVLFTRWGGDAPLEGRVRIVEPLAFTKISALGVEEQRVNVIADITTSRDVWQRLGAGYRVEASFILWESDKVLQVPASSVFRAGDGWAVFTIDNGLARSVPVQIGHRNGTAAEVLSGLAEGAAVITHPDSSMEEGKPVTART